MAAPELVQNWKAKAFAVTASAFAIMGADGIANDAKAEQLPQPTPVVLTEEDNTRAQIIFNSIDHAQDTQEIGIKLLIGNKEIEAGWTPVGLGDAIEGLLKDRGIPSKAFEGYSGTEESSISFHFVHGVEELGSFTFDGTLASLDDIEAQYKFQTEYLEYKRKQELQSPEEVASMALEN